MDFSLSEEDEAFARSFREWLGEHLVAPPAFVDVAEEVAWGRQWQAALAADRWVGVHWPHAYGGRSATAVQVALYQSEYARSQAPQPVNRVGINLVGPDPARPRHRGTAPAVDAQASCRPRRSGASCSPNPTPAATSRHSTPGPNASTGGTCSPARRSGPPTRSSPASGCVSPAAIPTRHAPNRASPPSR